MDRHRSSKSRYAGSNPVEGAIFVMDIRKKNAKIALDNLFKTIKPVNETTSFVSVELDNCTLYIPVNNLNEAKVSGFKRMFKKVYDLAKD